MQGHRSGTDDPLKALTRPKNGLLTALMLVLVGSMFLNFTWNGRDFEVFWKTAQYVLSGEPAYSVARDGAWVFKYPPWLLPLFLPFGWLTLPVAKGVWASLQVAAFVSVFRKVLATSRQPVWIFLVCLLFWGLWQVNAQDGQVSLLLLAVWLWAGSDAVFEKLSLKSTSLLGISFIKVFTAFPLFALRYSGRALGNILRIAIFILAPLSLPALWVTPGKSVPLLLHSYIEAMASGGRLLSYDGVRGKYNQGLTGFFLRTLKIAPEQTYLDIGVFLILGFLLGFAWHRVSRALPSFSRWTGWIALTPVVHPLPFWYSFVLTFPLAAVSLSSAMESRSRSARILAIAGVLMITVLTEKTLGSLGASLELLSVKAWGVLICAGAMIVTQRAERRSHPSN